jgi:cell wall-associated NlpC family hydrolase
MRHHWGVRRRPVALFATAAGCTLLGVLVTTGEATDSRTSVREDAVSWAIAQDGTTERGETNCSPKIDRWQRGMGLNVPPCRVWCGAFVHQAYKRAGINLSSRLIDPDRSYDDAIAGRRHLRQIPVSSVRTGDIVFYKFRNGVRASHLALARGKPSNGKLDTVEGNTSNAVRLETRGTQYIVLAARVMT